ncbi:GNAT family N-acetyltransferase [Pseudoduganella namucuonensis]|uniref:N-acetylglutamate synthase, GNAT family n=1 Tax=Pseudoduganella namucuonensis TaxID=1035707 RepID=A0A1I7L1G5_9BURK|nr:GNAT family N-acetyltransferase [Pseudoduganella namucuonensis]SFV03583.1 N-acetylglutamate synthase, GNAT family [Pseudoduganella namucuonensis]
MLQKVYESQSGEYLLSTDQSRLDVDTVYQFLAESSSWARGISRGVVELAIANSLCFALYRDGALLAFCRIVTDGATFGNLVDVFVVPDMRGRGLSRVLMGFVMSHPLVPRLRRFTLATTDSHGLYRKFGFDALTKPETFMEIYQPNIYRLPP